MNIAIIPARGGSKRIPRKNIRLFCGKPMIAWPIEAALASGCFDQVIVSTDDPEIAEVARLHGASTPFMRPAALSDDFTGTGAVTRHAIEWLQQQGQHPDDVCCLYATAPFVRPEDLSKGLTLLRSGNAEQVFTATTFPFPIQRAIRLTEQGCEPIFPEHIRKRSQDLEEAWHDAGQFYWASANTWCTPGRSMFSAGSRPLILPRYRVQDIDTEEDWVMAEYLFDALSMAPHKAD